jgi:hypothetical protein
MPIISVLDFLAQFPMFGGVDQATILSAINQAESEYDSSLPNWLPITMNLIAHILTVRALGVAQTVDLMGVANGTSKFSMGSVSINESWKGHSLVLTPYGQEVNRLLVGATVGILFL